ncbi:hypothetical protein MAR_017059 [Mya arenaria]|uniref:DDE-1 domain-containing protein n=1 Tax=Mya arenaria TaxID=6604 RepID=A0ABY7EE22_MYAAR|nr:hypothetical protein MAR_017059 [Mya arenaria]
MKVMSPLQSPVVCEKGLISYDEGDSDDNLKEMLSVLDSSNQKEKKLCKQNEKEDLRERLVEKKRSVDELKKDGGQTSGKRKREYSSNDEETRAKIARYAVDNGVAKAARRFTSDLNRKVIETTVRSMRDRYVKLKKTLGEEPTVLAHSPLGAPTLLGQYDETVHSYIRRMRVSGGVVNIRTVRAAAEGIMKKYARHKLRQFGGHVAVEKSLARSILRRMGFVKRKGTKATKTLSADLEDIKDTFVSKVQGMIQEHHIPDSLVLNFDQTGCHMVQGGEWTMEERGSAKVTIAGLDGKRQMTALLTVTKSGRMLPPQLIYTGKTDRCLPKGWDLTCTESHWSDGGSMVRFAEKILLPYINGVRESLPLAQAHQSPEFHRLLRDNGICYTYVPAACTDCLQPLDLTVNFEYIENIKSCFHEWYSAQVVSLLDDDANDMTAVTQGINVTADIA